VSAGLAIFVTDLDVVGGSERQALLLARTLAGRGVPVDLITTTSRRLPRRRQRLAVPGEVRLRRLPPLLVEPVAGALLGARRGSLRGVYGIGLMMGAIATRVGRALDLPTVVRLAGAGQAGDMVALSRLASGDRTLVLDDLRRAHVVCVTDEVRREALAAGLAPERLVRIPNGVDVAAVDAAPAVRPRGDVPTVLFLGRLDRAKGADVLLEAFAVVAPDVPRARLLLAGEGTERGALEAQARALGIEPRVDFLGRRDDPFALLKGATVVALPSRSEGMSNTLLEALAAGCAVVASGIEANHEVGGGGAALLVAPGDRDDLAGALGRCLRDDDLRATLGRAARARASDFAIERVADAHLALFDRLGPPRARGLASLAAGLAGARARDVSRVLRRLTRPPPGSTTRDLAL
jgi:glycosyltransferase involved in cell wall biosynthesis